MHKIKTITWGLVPFAQLANVGGWWLVGMQIEFPVTGWVFFSFLGWVFLATTIFVSASQISKNENS
jgi:hypothetical protein